MSHASPEPTSPADSAELRAQVPFFADARSLTLAPLEGVVSLNNANFRVDADGDAFLLRVGADSARWLGVRRDEELAAARAAADAGVGPEVLWADGNGLLVQAFVHGATHWGADAIVDPARRAPLLDALRRLHAVEAVDARCTVYQRIERLLASADTLGLTRPDGVDAACEGLADFAARRAGRFRPGLCHNDLWLNNFVEGGDGRLWLVDWEFAGVADPLYDLTTLALCAPLDAAGRERLLTDYGITDAAALDDMAAMERAVRVFEGAWALVLHGLRGSASGFDYRAYADRCFELLAASNRAAIAS